MARLTGLDRNEALQYLGYRGGPLEPELAEALARCEATLLAVARPRLSWRLFPLTPEGQPEGAALRLEGQDIRALLRDCDRVILFGATLGAEAEALLHRTQARDMAEAVILDACGSAAIENVCDNFCADLAERLAPAHLTDRFSPGYGDLPFAVQGDFCRVLELERRIGVTLSDGGLMLPQKSVTAVIGVADRPQPRRSRGCAACGLFGNCVYQKEGKSCGAQ